MQAGDKNASHGESMRREIQFQNIDSAPVAFVVPQLPGLWSLCGPFARCIACIPQPSGRTHAVGSLTITPRSCSTGLTMGLGASIRFAVLKNGDSVVARRGSGQHTRFSGACSLAGLHSVSGAAVRLHAATCGSSGTTSYPRGHRSDYSLPHTVEPSDGPLVEVTIASGSAEQRNPTTVSQAWRCLRPQNHQAQRNPD